MATGVKTIRSSNKQSAIDTTHEPESELHTRIACLESENATLRQRVDELEAENTLLQASLDTTTRELEKLRREIGRHSQNSGKPPSSDTVTQRATQTSERLSRAERRRKAREKAKQFQRGDKPKRRPGKQPGTPGAHLAQVDDPDKTYVHSPELCHECGQSLADAETVGCDRRQVFDLPVRRLEIVEHLAETRRCECGQTTKGLFPVEAKATVSYGPHLRATAIYLMVYQHVPVARAAALLSEVCGAPVSTGWLAGLNAEAALRLEPFLTWLRAQLIAEQVLHADETGARVSGARYWFHVASTDLLTLLDCHPHRGVEAFEHMKILPFFNGILISDGWKPYWAYHHYEHALCCAHLLRDLAAISQSPRHHPWADQMADLLVEVKDAVATALTENQPGLTANQLKAYRARYTKILNHGRRKVPKHHQPGTINRDAHNLLQRFDRQRHEIQRYWTNPAVSFDNNQAERDIRMIRIHQKISGTFRTSTGAKAFCAIRSYLQTAQKHGLQMLDVLTQLFQGTPWIPDPPPD